MQVMSKAWRKALKNHEKPVFSLLRFYLALNKKVLLHDEVLEALGRFCQEYHDLDPCLQFINNTFSVVQEVLINEPQVFLALRPNVGEWYYLGFNVGEETWQPIPVVAYLRFKEGLVVRREAEDILEIDFAPFSRFYPGTGDINAIGKGRSLLGRILTGRLAREGDQGRAVLLERLRKKPASGQLPLINATIDGVAALRQALKGVESVLAELGANPSRDKRAKVLAALGFGPGWGADSQCIRENTKLLAALLDGPDPKQLIRFLERLFPITRVVVLSPHGYFGQDNVLGLPDTGGQVVYILDQVRALETEMQRRLDDQGVGEKASVVVLTRLIPEAGDTTCDQRLEPIRGTERAVILRVPFRDAEGKSVPQWISRFDLWPYLERFTRESGRELRAFLGNAPDLIIGNYSDGNLVAALLSQTTEAVVATIAHALEKTKYFNSALYWQEQDHQYHFSCQFTADLLGMNAADFIIASTFQEIAGGKFRVGQYESHHTFTMPGLQRVVHGIDIHHPKFNIISPGVDTDLFFSHGDSMRRLTDLHETIREVIFGTATGPGRRGRFANPEKPLLFTMARLDKIKNITGLVELFGRENRLREAVNLLVISGNVEIEDSKDREEQEQIRKMHRLMDRYGLDGQVRWLSASTDRRFNGELYRVIADHRGAFVQPAIYEAFGLTVLEAMSSGLPTFATRHGGPREVIEDGVSGFHIDPYRSDKAAERMAEFFEKCQAIPDYWTTISEGGIKRVRDHFTWRAYAEKTLTLASQHAFGKWLVRDEREGLKRYLEMFHRLQFRPLAAKIANSSPSKS